MAMQSIELMLICDNNLLTIGGEQQSTYIIADFFKEKVSVGVIQPGSTDVGISGVSVFGIGSSARLKYVFRNPFCFVKYILKIRTILNSTRPSIIHTQSQVVFFIVAMLRRLRLLKHHSVFIHTERGLYLKYSLFFKSLFLHSFRYLDILVLTTDYNKSSWSNAAGTYRDMPEMLVIENTAGDLFEDRENSTPQLLPIDGIYCVGFAGRYTDWKNWPLAVAITEKLLAKFPDRVKVIMAIGCFSETEVRSVREMYDKLMQTYGDRFVGYINVKHSKMVEFYDTIDFFVLTSNKNTESFGRTIVEAMQRHTIVLGTDAGGSTEVIGNRDNILNEPDEFVSRIAYYMMNPDILTMQKLRNKERVQQLYSLNNNTQKHVEMYSKYILKELR